MRPWREAWERALYGPGGFYARGEAPAAHFRTSVHASPLFAAAVGELLERVDAALGHPDPLDLVDVGAGRGELLAGVAAHTDLGRRLRLTAVEVGPGIDAVRDVAALSPVTGLLIANEWLDDVPLDVVVRTPAGPRLVLVDDAGTETLGGPPPAEDLTWADLWWPAHRRPPTPHPTATDLTGSGRAGVGDAVDPAWERVEVGRARDVAWASAVRRMARGVVVAVDYGHERAARPAAGTLTGYRGGRQVPPVPDGSCDLTAHVALDSVAAAGRAAGAGDTRLDDQRAALANLGVTGRRPPVGLATSDPARYAALLRDAAEAAELLDRRGLGGFGWLVQGVGITVPFGPHATRGRVRRAPAPPPT